MIQQRKQIRTYSQMLSAYESSCVKIQSRYSAQVSRLTAQSVHTLCTLFENYLQTKRKVNEEGKGCQNESSHNSDSNTWDSKGGYNGNKHGCEGGHGKGGKYQYKTAEEQEGDQPSFWVNPVSQKKKKIGKKIVPSDNVIISKQINRLSIDSDLLLMEDQQDQQDSPTKKLEIIKDIKNKNLTQMIIQSQRKLMEKQEQKITNNIDEQEQQSEYEITDYSSNQSSNECNYQTHYKEDFPQNLQKPLFGGLFSKKISSDSNNSNSSNILTFNFSSKQLLKSPKKNQKGKRLYVGSKKIPQWAENLQQIELKCYQQGKQNTNAIFGKCVVQNLDTNVLFQGREIISRTSSAKWNHQQMFII